MRADAIFRLIIAMFFASLPLLLAIQRSRRARARRTAVEREPERTTEQPPTSNRREDKEAERKRPRTRGRFRSFLHQITSGFERTLQMEPDEDLRERPRQPATVRTRHRRSTGTGAEPQRRTRIPTPAGVTGKRDRPDSGSEHAAESQPSVAPRLHRKRRAERGAEALTRIEHLPLLQRAIAYQEILGTPRGLRDPGTPDPPGTREF